jgi:hypothetical protein
MAGFPVAFEFRRARVLAPAVMEVNQNGFGEFGDLAAREEKISRWCHYRLGTLASLPANSNGARKGRQGCRRSQELKSKRPAAQEARPADVKTE